MKQVPISVIPECGHAKSTSHFNTTMYPILYKNNLPTNFLKWGHYHNNKLILVWLFYDVISGAVLNEVT